jgi:transposase
MIGRPSIDPDLMLRMLIVGHCMGIRSERRLCDEVHLNLAYRWFRRLGLNGQVPDHSTFSRNRHGRFRESNILRRLFESVVELCLREGLIGGDGFAVDASLIAADANKHRSLQRMERRRHWTGRVPCRARVSGDARRCRIRRSDREHPEVRLAVGPGRAMDGRRSKGTPPSPMPRTT